MVEKIMFATDGSEHSQKALAFTAEMASRYEARVYIINVVAKPTIPPELLEYLSAEEIDEPPVSVYLDKIGKQLTNKCDLEFKSKGVGECQPTVLRGDPAEMILDFAKEHEIDTIVMGSRGLGPLKSRLLGSVTRKVMHGAICTCIIAK